MVDNLQRKNLYIISLPKFFHLFISLYILQTPSIQSTYKKRLIKTEYGI